MKEKYLRRTFDKNIVSVLMAKGIPQSIAEILSARGINCDNYDEYFGSRMTFHSPFDMLNMSEAVETISYVIECGGSILIYGDYDADGLTASSILSLFFNDNGVDCDVIIPTREEGYGLHAEKVIKAFENKFYDLVITVDCGISNAEEVSAIIEELGVEMIVTDHHELPAVLPECICVNPKLGYPFPYLAGAGVAWKLVEAIAGRDTAAKYAELAAIGTIGDLMPMRDENRSIIKLGLVNRNHKSLRKLAELSHCAEQLSSSDIAMKIAPKINAAGRVGNPLAALDVLLSRDSVNILSVNNLLELNEQRKGLLDEIIASADGMCDDKIILREKMVFIYSDAWQHGLLGIVASRYKEKYNVPTLVMTLDGDNYVGSARGIDGIDLYEAFSKCQCYLTKFGGHKASVGFSVSVENLEKFRTAISSAFTEYDDSVFEKHIYYDIELGADCSFNDILDLSNKLQPLLPQEKLVCRITDSVKFANSFGKDNAHLTATLSCGLEIKGFFKYGAYAPLIRDGANVDVICSLETDSYSKNVCGIIEDISLNNSVCFDEFYRLNLLKNFAINANGCIDSVKVSETLKKASSLAVFDDYETFLKYSEQFDFSDYWIDVFFDNSVSTKTVVISPTENYGYGRYENIVSFNSKGVCRNIIGNVKYFEVIPASYDLYLLDINRDVCMKSFSALKHKNKFDSIKGAYDKYLLGKITYPQYVVSLRIFEELGFIKIVDKYEVEFDTTKKSDLTNSKIYMYFQKK